MNKSTSTIITENYIKGTILQEIYYKEENGYGVYAVQVMEDITNEGMEEIVIVGQFIRLHESEIYTFFGEWKEHPKFGLQYHVKQLRKELPDSKEAIIKYLSSDLFHGVGKKTAEKIVEKFGEDTLDEIAKNPNRLKQIKGIASAQMKTIIKGIEEHFSIEKVLVHLYQIGLGPALSLKIIQTYKQETLKVVQENPYQLSEDIDGIGFHRADEIAKLQGIAENDPRRLQAAVLFLIRESAHTEGHIYITHDELEAQLPTLLGITNIQTVFPEEKRNEYLAQMKHEKKIFQEEERYYIPSLYYAEYGIAKHIAEMIDQDREPSFPIADIYRVIGEIEEKEKVSYADKQREAFVTAFSSSIMILTGGPGTGKTTVIKGICQAFAALNEFSLDPNDYRSEDKIFPIRLVAPTGRAAKRMNETTGLPAMTIHRLLGYRGDYFEHDMDDPIEGSLLIVDEVSMVDTYLANQLFRSIPKEMKVILVGDQDQLPSVGPGQVLYHLLQVSDIPRVELNEIFRQEEGSSIIRLAHRMKQGEIPDDLLLPMEDRRFFPCGQEQCGQVILKTYINAIKRGYTLNDVQILIPKYKGNVGINQVNQWVQQAVNPKKEGKKEIIWGDTIFRLGDKVLQLVNHPEHPVYNGDMGIVIAIDEDVESDQPVLWVRYDQLEVPYRKNQLGQIQLAYACSIHKAQGSEFAIVILPVLYAYRHMLKRNLLYTAITRSKSYLILCGEQKAFAYGVQKGLVVKRNSQLKELIILHK